MYVHFGTFLLPLFTSPVSYLFCCLLTRILSLHTPDRRRGGANMAARMRRQGIAVMGMTPISSVGRFHFVCQTPSLCTCTALTAIDMRAWRDTFLNCMTHSPLGNICLWHGHAARRKGFYFTIGETLQAEGVAGDTSSCRADGGHGMTYLFLPTRQWTLEQVCRCGPFLAVLCRKNLLFYLPCMIMPAA